jgi:hypothetical protein
VRLCVYVKERDKTQDIISLIYNFLIVKYASLLCRSLIPCMGIINIFVGSSRLLSLYCVLVVRSDNDHKINKESLWKGRKFRLLLSEDSPTCKLQPYN